MLEQRIHITNELWFPSTHDIPVETVLDDPNSPIADSFDWHYIHSALSETLGRKPQEMDVPVFEFKSIQKLDLSDGIKEDLNVSDEEATEDIRANHSDVFYKYFAGKVVNRISRSLCIWENTESAAKIVRSNEKHRKAAKLAMLAYEPEIGMQVSWHRLHISQTTGIVALELIK